MIFKLMFEMWCVQLMLKIHDVFFLYFDVKKLVYLQLVMMKHKDFFLVY